MSVETVARRHGAWKSWNVLSAQPHYYIADLDWHPVVEVYTSFLKVMSAWALKHSCALEYTDIVRRWERCNIMALKESIAMFFGRHELFFSLPMVSGKYQNLGLEDSKVFNHLCFTVFVLLCDEDCKVQHLLCDNILIHCTESYLDLWKAKFYDEIAVLTEIWVQHNFIHCLILQF